MSGLLENLDENGAKNKESFNKMLRTGQLFLLDGNAFALNIYRHLSGNMLIIVLIR
jgi:hypothetical protein